MIHIEDPDDVRIGDYREVRERDLVGRRGVFIAEGEVVLERLLTARGFEAVSVLVTGDRAERIDGMVQALSPQTPVFRAARPVMDAIAGFPIHRGVLAVGRRRSTPSPRELLARLPERCVVIGLLGLSNHDNVGGIFRNAAAFGAVAVLLDNASCDPLYRKAVRVSVGAALTVPFARLGEEDDVLDLLSAFGFVTYALSPAGTRDLLEVRPPARCAVLFGAEGPGLPQDLLDRAETVRISMSPGFDSLNVATTSGVVLHWMRAAAGVSAPSTPG